MTAEQLIQEMPKGLIKWYDFEKGSNALYITAGQEMDTTMIQALRECEVCVRYCTIEEVDSMSHLDKYAYVIMLSAIERTGSSEKAAGLLRKVRSLMNRQGKLFLGMDNRLGVRYFCGDRDAYTGRNFDGIENYARANLYEYDLLEGRCFSKAEIVDILNNAGFVHHRFYSVFPLLQYPQILFAEDYIPNEKLDIRLFPQYHFPDTVFLEEEKLYDTLIQNGLFHTMANGFWIECPMEGLFANVNQITMSPDRGKNNAMFTVICRDDRVEKRAMYQEGRQKIEELAHNNKYLSEHGINMVELKAEGEKVVMPYVHSESALKYLRDLILEDTALFFQRLDELWELIIQSSEHIPYSDIDWEKYEPYWERRRKDDPQRERWKKVANGTKEEQESIGIILKRGYIDLVPLNCFWQDGQFVFYDQELYINSLPAKVILLRTIDLIYMGNFQLEKVLSIECVKERYGLSACRELFYSFIRKFLNDLRNDAILKQYHTQVRRDNGVVNANRQRINYETKEYEKIFRDIFKGAENRRLYLFGSGGYASQFLSQFSDDYVIEGILDNNKEKWTTTFQGIKIYSPDILKVLEPGTFKVIICIRNYMGVMQQLQEMGIRDFSVYESSLCYQRKKAVHFSCDKELKQKKKYHIGYIAGVFDLFHIGHLNMFRRAKEECDYLIVGVVTDEGVMKAKRTMPFIPFDERIEIVRSCRYVDEAVEIPPEYSNTDEAYRRYQFDVQFSGSDYEHDEGWLAKRDYLRKQGANLVFFPYTESTSSSYIKELINKKLL